MDIFIVMGTTGEYSDRSEWPVIAYQDESLANRHVYLATGKANEIYGLMIDNINDDDLPENPYDPNMKMDYTGTNYFVYKTYLWESDLND
jgi:hypothetical protein